MDPNYIDPYVQQWSLDIQRQVQPDATVSIVTSAARYALNRYCRYQPVPPGAAAAAGLVPAGGYITSGIRPRLNILRPYRGYNAINAVMSAFQLELPFLTDELQQTIRQNGNVGVAYTWSKNLTDNQSDRSNAAQNTSSWHAGEYGRAFLDRRHVLTASTCILCRSS